MSNLHDEQEALNQTEEEEEVRLKVSSNVDLPTQEEEGDASRKNILYRIDEVPPWYLSILLGLQHFFLMTCGMLSVPYILIPLLCIQDDLSKGQIISTTFFVSGIATIMQASLGCRLPIIQGTTFALLPPTMAILSTSFDSCETYNYANMTSDEKNYIWMTRMRAIQGTIIVASVTQVLIGLTGIVGFMASWITPLTIAPTITLIGLSLFKVAANRAATHWGISIMTTLFFALFSQYLTAIPVSRSKGRKFLIKISQMFTFFPILSALFFSWIICAILTAFEVFPEDSEARTDGKISLLLKSPWFYVPYPFQWGLPTVTITGVIGMVSGILSSIVESIGDYYTCCSLTESGPLPEHALNRGIFTEGIGSIIAGIFGTGNGTTSFSGNIAALRLTKVASKRVIYVAAIILILCGICAKIVTIYLLVPNPIIGGIFIIIFGIVVSVGLSNLQVVDLNSSRNIFILGASIFIGLSIPEWLQRNPGSIQTGFREADQVLLVLLKTSMFVGGSIGFILDNTIPGSPEERGLTKWNKIKRTPQDGSTERIHKSSIYDFPIGMEFLRRHKIFSRIPISPTFEGRKG